MYKYKSLHLSFLQSLLNFIITKCLKQEVDDDLSLCMDECSPCGLSTTVSYKDLSMSHDQKVMMLLPPTEKCPINYYHRIAFTAQIW